MSEILSSQERNSLGKSSHEERLHSLLLVVKIVAIEIGAIGILWFSIEKWPALLPDTEFWKVLRDTVIHISALVAVFYAIFEFWTRKDFAKLVELGILKVFRGNEQVFKSLSIDLRRRFVENSINATMGNKIGNVIFTEIVDPYFRSFAPYRRECEYQIDMLPSWPDFGSLNTEAGKKLASSFKTAGKYLWLTEKIQYQSWDPKSDSAFRGPFVICLTFDKLTLQRLLQKNDIFFREIIELETDLADVIAKASKEEAEELVKEIFCVKICEMHREEVSVRYSVQLASDDAGKKYLEITTPKLPKASPANGICISFNIPQFKEVTWYIATLPQLCDHPKITFRGNSEISRLEPVYFLSNIEPEKVRTEEFNLKYTVFFDGWTFPTSGVMFTWRH
jgi:hypothetical protein